MVRIAIYMRLSKEDEKDCRKEESNSIRNQRALAEAYVKDHFKENKLLEFQDDGYTGTNFDRPGVTALLKEVKDGKIDCIVVKDFSRFSRDYIELGSYIEQIFPFMKVMKGSKGEESWISGLNICFMTYTARTYL